jgi:hypothetical protein
MISVRKRQIPDPSESDTGKDMSTDRLLKTALLRYVEPSGTALKKQMNTISNLA